MDSEVFAEKQPILCSNPFDISDLVFLETSLIHSSLWSGPVILHCVNDTLPDFIMIECAAPGTQRSVWNGAFNRNWLRCKSVRAVNRPWLVDLVHILSVNWFTVLVCPLNCYSGNGIPVSVRSRFFFFWRMKAGLGFSFREVGGFKSELFSSKQ